MHCELLTYRGATTSIEIAWYINEAQLIIDEGKTLRCPSCISLLQFIPRRDVRAFRRVSEDRIFFMLLCFISREIS
jgi:hypothetical protein